jgi:hypothetical protein
MWRARGGEDGQAAVELVAVLPVLAAIALLCWQALIVGEAWWLAGTAAREGARAAALGGDPRAAAAGSLPARLRRDLHVTRGHDDAAAIRVQVAVPAVLARVRLGSVSARARMEPQA